MMVYGELYVYRFGRPCTARTDGRTDRRKGGRGRADGGGRAEGKDGRGGQFSSHLNDLERQYIDFHNVCAQINMLDKNIEILNVLDMPP